MTSEELQKRVIEALKVKAPDTTCPLCHTNRWNVVPGTLLLGLKSSSQYGSSYIQNGLPSVAIVCLHCGNTHLLNLSVLLPDVPLGIWGSMPNKPPEFTTTDLAVTKVMRREFLLYIVHETELEQLFTGYTSIHFGCAGISIGILATLLITRMMAESPSLYVRLAFLCGILICAVFSFYFIAMATKDYRNARKALGRIKTQTQTVAIKSAEE